jgi:hypothetical protein
LEVLSPSADVLCRAALGDAAQPEWTIGRSLECEVILQGTSISRHHAMLYVSDRTGQLLLLDLGSTHGTTLLGAHARKVGPERVEITIYIVSRRVLLMTAGTFFSYRWAKASRAPPCCSRRMV